MFYKNVISFEKIAYKEHFRVEASNHFAKWEKVSKNGGKLQKWKGKHVQKFTARGLESPGAQHFTDYTPQTTRSVCK